uniref:Uncharacterized protein n=1 Tax=Poecilia latipinna TaxID=48699 RepID=A0A3B3W1M4_9TELE
MQSGRPSMMDVLLLDEVCSVSRPGKRRGLFWKTLLGLSVGFPLAVGVKYATAEPRQRRRMRIVVEGFGRFCRSLSVGIFISVDYWWTTNVALRGMDEVRSMSADVCVCVHQSRH